MKEKIKVDKIKERNVFTKPTVMHKDKKKYTRKEKYREILIEKS